MTRWTELIRSFDALRKWEQQKRRERLLLEALVYALLAALILVPVRDWLPFAWAPLWAALACFGLVAVVLFVGRRWRDGQFVGVLNQLDHKLGLQERAVTAWEILRRGGERPWERLVLEDAEARLEGLNARSVFERQPGWRAYAAPVLLLLVALMAWLPAGTPTDESARAASLAQQIKELASQLEREAAEEDLAQSLLVARELEEVAEKQLRGESNEAELGHAVGAVLDSMENAFQGLPADDEVDWGGLAPGSMSKLKEKLRELRNTQDLPDSLRAGRRGMMDELGLASLDRRRGARENMSEQEIREFLNKLDRESTREQDRRSLERTRQFLTELLLRNPSEGSGMQQFAAPGVPDGSRKPGQGQAVPGSQPGDAPGRPGMVEAYDPSFRARVRTHLEGLLGEGPSRGFSVRGEARGGTSVVPEEEVVVRYERQIEEQLSSEEIPSDFKDTIKNYFLSLGVTQRTP